MFDKVKLALLLMVSYRATEPNQVELRTIIGIFISRRAVSTAWRLGQAGTTSWFWTAALLTLGTTGAPCLPIRSRRLSTS